METLHVSNCVSPNCDSLCKMHGVAVVSKEYSAGGCLDLGALTDYLWRICSLCAHRSPLTYEGNLMMVWSWIVEPCLNWPFALADASQMNHLTVKELLWKFLMCIRLNSVDPVMQRSSLVGVLDLSGGSLRTLLPKQ
ncbi:hypothetical protein MKW98_030672 [Papaver atlanticum]|uniref:Uncharacterized protein n=1 Tax=Papaver atlanticum TaxID=357466 RepID=A0AAD4X2I3_9MAGN|nr:hypothetical protein MKW98_030672 [Papaver atlanticum]